MNHPTISAVLCALAVLASFATSASAESRKPNVIILFIDDLGYGDLACFGNTFTPTPHMDSLAGEGAILTMSYVTNPPCSPSRSCLMTGMYAQRFHKFGMARGLPIPDDHPTLAEFMRDAGYVTGQIGKWDLGGPGQGPHQRGFMEVARWGNAAQGYFVEKPDGSKLYRTEMDGDHMVEFVERNKDKPFFLYFSPLAIHSPLKGTPKRYQNRIKSGNKAYGGAVAAVDDQIGKLLAVLRKHDLEKNTLILLTGDNGAGSGGSSAPYTGGKHAGTSKEGWVHTPAVAWWPGTIPAGQKFGGLTCTLDYYTTAASVAGKQAPEKCDGKNLIPYLTGKRQGDVHEYVYWYNADPKDSPHRHLSAVRWKQWRLHWDKRDKAWKLYDLHADPREENDLAAKHPEVLKQLKAKHEAFVATLPSLDTIPAYKSQWSKPPDGFGWLIGDGNAD
ncbi:N-acetylgalactosamine-6-sulfatase [Haloferula helveola]|uniref:N-acetylgalactosamine-6-sulfatase n=1 Tax=Haloferula helveola TaxID=490095 RepID=A0ABN6H9A8_9BACT|nr:N-acetylgalactosamine-6-sulfatase [Haloferula helveola]